MAGLNAHIHDENNKNIESNNNFNLEKKNTGISEEQQDKFRKKLDNEKRIQKTKQEQDKTELLNKLNQHDSNFIEKLSVIQKGKELLSLIQEKKKEYINSDDREIIKKYMPILYNLGIPVFIGDQEHENMRTGVKAHLEENIEKFEYLKKIDKIIGELPRETKEEMKKLLINIVVFAGAWGGGDATIDIGYSYQYSSEEEIKGVFLHEFTHVKHQAIAYSDQLFNEKINTINKDQPKKIEVFPPLPIGKYIWFEEDDIKTLNGLEVEFKNGEKINFDGFKYGDDGKTIKEMGGEKGVYEYLKNLMGPRYGFITPYASHGGRSMNSYGNLLGEPVKVKMNVEEFSNIVEVYYLHPERFKEIILNTKEGNIIPLDQKYDKEAQYPLIREKLRLIIEYGFFPKGEFDQYFEKIVLV